MATQSKTRKVILRRPAYRLYYGLVSKPVRDHDGHVKLQRAYDFEYSDTGNHRLKGSIVMLGHRVLMLNVEPDLPLAVRTLH